MKIRIAKTVLKQNSPELDNLFSNLKILSKDDMGEIVEYTTPGEGEIDVHYLDGVFLMGIEQGFNLAIQGALLPGDEIVLTEEESKPKPEEKKSLSIDVGKTEAVKDGKDIVIKPKGRPAKQYKVIKGGKIINTDGKYLKVGEVFTKADIQKPRQIRNMINWNWCIEQS